MDSESEFEADPEELEEVESSDAESDYAASDSDDFDGGSDGSAGDGSDEGLSPIVLFAIMPCSHRYVHRR
jgi:hypothetical protein